MLQVLHVNGMYSNPKSLHILETSVWFSVLTSSFYFYLNSLQVNWIVISKIYNWIYILDLLINSKKLIYVFDGIKIIKSLHVLKNVLCSLAQKKIPGNIPSEHSCLVRQLKIQSFAISTFSITRLHQALHTVISTLVFYLESAMFTTVNIGLPGICVLAKKVDSKIQVDC